MKSREKRLDNKRGCAFATAFHVLELPSPSQEEGEGTNPDCDCDLLNRCNIQMESKESFELSVFYPTEAGQEAKIHDCNE